MGKGDAPHGVRAVARGCYGDTRPVTHRINSGGGPGSSEGRWGQSGVAGVAPGARSNIPILDPLPELVSVYTACDKLLSTPACCLLCFFFNVFFVLFPQKGCGFGVLASGTASDSSFPTKPLARSRPGSPPVPAAPFISSPG